MKYGMGLLRLRSSFGRETSLSDLLARKGTYCAAGLLFSKRVQGVMYFYLGVRKKSCVNLDEVLLLSRYIIMYPPADDNMRGLRIYCDKVVTCSFSGPDTGGAGLRLEYAALQCSHCITFPIFSPQL